MYQILCGCDVMKVVNFGSLNIDHVYTLDHIVTPGETLACASLDIVAGGKGMNQSVALAKCGVDTVHAGCVGTDGGWLRDMLVGVGVDCSYLRDTNCPNGHAVIQVEKNGQNSIFIFGGSNQQLTEELIDETLSDLSGDCMVVMQNETSNIVHVAEGSFSSHWLSIHLLSAKIFWHLFLLRQWTTCL